MCNFSNNFALIPYRCFGHGLKMCNMFCILSSDYFVLRFSQVEFSRFLGIYLLSK